MKWALLLVTAVIFYSIAFKMRKQLQISEMITTIFFALLLVITVDVYASFRFQAWGFFNVNKVDFSTMLIYIGIYPAAAVIFMNGYPYKSLWWKKFFYLMGWALFSTAYEGLSIKVGIIWHINWNLFYSFVLYPILFYVLILQLRAYRWIKQIEPEVVRVS